jgi:glycerophosphoryl diester phosphodiesterase
VLLVGGAALLLARLIGADSAAPSAASIAEQVVTVVVAQAVAIAVVARTRVLAGLTFAAGARTGTHSARAGLAATVLAGSAAALLVAGALPPWIAEPAAARQQDRPLVIAHRGYDAGGPENTIAGLEAAARFHPDHVEVDVQQTADGDYVASHDVNLTVLAGKNESIYEMSTGEVTRTTVTMHGHSDTIPTMTEYVRRAGELKIPLLIELKVTGHEKREPVAELLAQLDASGTTATHAFHSLDSGAVQELKRQRPELRVGLTLGLNLGQLPRTECDFYVVEQASITPGMIDEAHRQGRDLYAWTVNEGPAMQALLDIGVDGLVTDRPDGALRVSAAVAAEEDAAG